MKQYQDATKDLRFRVTRRAIDEGVAGDANRCIFACALGDRKGVVYAEVRPNFTRIVFSDGRRLHYVTPRELRMALKAFDIADAAIVEPGTYTLLAPTGVRRIASRRKAVQAHEDRVAAGTAKSYKPRSAPPSNVAAVLTKVRSSVWGAQPKTVVTIEPDPLAETFPYHAPWSSGDVAGPPKP